MLTIVDDNTGSVTMAGLSYADLFLIETSLINTACEIDDARIIERAERLIEGCSAATEMALGQISEGSDEQIEN